MLSRLDYRVLGLKNARSLLLNIGTERMVGTIEPPIGWLIFNNPERRNAVSLDMWEAIPAILEKFANDSRIRAVVVTGAGERAFVSGADISQFDKLRSSPEENDRYAAISSGARAALRDFPKPTIAMIRGYCIGGGMAVALACDLRLASEDAKFGIPAARLGLGYGFSGVQRLVSVIGPAFAKEMLFTARHFSAQEALRIGLVNAVTPSEELEKTARSYAEMISANAPLTVRAAKLSVEQALLDPEKRRTQDVADAIRACFASEDYAEGRAAFRERRKPVFKGR